MLLFDEPINGLDPEGILWVRNLLKQLATEGRTIFYSSHLMSEMSQTATDLVVIGKGSLIADTTVDNFIESHTVATVSVRTPDPAGLRAAVERAGGQIEAGDDGELLVTGIDAASVGDAAHGAQVALHELTPVKASLEEVFMELTSSSAEYQSGLPGASS